MNSFNYSQIDMHIHTINSDGTDTPEELIRNLLSSNIKIFSTTEHDTLRGIENIRNLSEQNKLHYINGIEITSCDEYGRYHILGYGFNKADSNLVSAIKSAQDLRKDKTVKRLNYIKDKYSFTIDDNDILKLLSKDNPCKPHVIQLMLKYNYIKTKEQGIEILNELKFKNEYLNPREAISAINNSNGISVLAHPIYGNGEDYIRGENLEKRILYLKTLGLMGVEGFYSRYSKDETSEVLKIANKYNLLISAGSDYHGLNKSVKLGSTNIIKPLPKGFTDFIDNVLNR